MQILYTHPVTPRAGEEATVFYNPDITVLRGQPEVHLRASWNRHAPNVRHAGCCEHRKALAFSLSSRSLPISGRMSCRRTARPQLVAASCSEVVAPVGPGRLCFCCISG